ncbi:Disease resistance-like protein DSC1 [Citrus sinensis]|uniref:Disease resistance-like protein DSC1 n=1 Tax=Citrus sinensis TaxID=2711 RepID=A0ACB8MBP1_CITSI|nr:Disease resistance-like protein DSC1 [Citrus sinensis]
MASSSSSCNYEVFLNFRGEDTRKSFTCYLYDKLYEGKKIKTFIDDEELRRGDEISPALLNAIQGSKISVVIFSKDYASSKWCLNELVKILECKNTNGQIIIPVFYGVSPSDVRHQNGTFGDRFDELKKQFEDKPEMVQKWRDALTETSHLAGHESTKFRHDAELVNKIVDDVLKKLEKITVSTDSSNGLVGLNSRIEQIKPFLCMDLWDTVHIVGIWGTGGIGKTTLAEAIFDQFSGEFDGKYFAKNVRRKSETEGGLEDLQKEMLSTILSEKLEVAGPNIPQFTKGRVRRMKVLIVLDDVNKDEQLEGLIGGLDQYGPGSRIVVTTRDKRVLEKFGVEKIYRVNGLKFDEAFEHFCNFAVKENHCPEDLYRHSWRVVWYADGNPLVLKVLGSSLYLKGKSHWENVLDDLNRICESDIHGIYDTLKISFKELTPRVKSMFLDIACFLEGEDKDFVLRILDDSGSHRLDVLVDKSLITVSDNCLQMHDLLQEMGREIVRQESEEEPGRRSRLWDPKEIRRVLKHNMGYSFFVFFFNKGTDAIEGIFLDLSKIKGINLDPGAFTKMSNLRLLKFYVPEIEKFLSMSIEEQLSYSKVQLPNGLDYLPKKLRYLHWDTYPLRTLPSNFKPKNLVELNLRFSKVEQLWEGEKEAFKLKSINLSHSRHFIKMPGPLETPNVETYLLDYTNLACVPSYIQNFKYLSRLDFMGCKSLRSFPSNLHFVCPVTIDFSYCVNLIEFPQISGKVTSLNLGQTAIEEVPSSVECLTDLEKLDLRHCKRGLYFCPYLYLEDCNMLQSLPELPLGLKFLELRDCKILQSLPELPLGLETLHLWRCNMLQSLPALPLGLETLHLEDCNMLRSLPELPLCLQSLIAMNCNRLQSLPEIPSCVQELDASVLEKLSKPSPDLRQWHPEYVTPQPIYFGFTNCLKLDGKANNKILADSLRMAIAASLRLGYENAYNEKLSELRESQIVLPGSEIPDWFSNQSSGSSIRIQLPPHSFCRNLIGFAFCAVLDFKQLYSDRSRYFYVYCRSDLEIKTLSETKHVDLSFYWDSIKDPHDSDHVILGFKPCLNVGFPDGYHHTTVSLKFFNERYRNIIKVQKGQKIKRCGVCPVYANPSEIKANTFTLNFATEVWKLDDLPSASGTAASEFDSSSDEGELYCIDSSSDEGELYYSFDDEELEPSP